MNLKNYTSTVPATISMGKIEQNLVAAGATENFFLIGLTISAIVISDSAWWALICPLFTYDLEKEK